MSDECAGWGWYLANGNRCFTYLFIFVDFQFFLLAPIFIILYYWKPVVGWIATAIAALASVAATIGIAGTKELTPFYQDMSAAFSDDIYSKPWCRAQPYLVLFFFCPTLNLQAGVALGFVMTNKNIVTFHVKWWGAALVYCVTFICLGIPWFGSYRLYYEFNSGYISPSFG